MGREDKRDTPLSERRILVAEDELLIALDLEAILSEAGAEVIGPFATLVSAIDAARQQDLSAAVLDIRLGRETTGEVVRILCGRGIPFLFYTGQTVPVDMMAISGVAPTLAKPAGRQALVTAITRLLQHSSYYDGLASA